MEDKIILAIIILLGLAVGNTFLARYYLRKERKLKKQV